MLIKIKQKKKDKLLRTNFAKLELKRVYYKFMKIISVQRFNSKNYIKYQRKLSNLPIVRYNNLCYVTARSRGIFRKFKLSRHQIRDKFKYLHGLTSSSW